ncbi:MAG TPA: hypothetical protein VLZ81_02470 [Blastocatellia bacterium]|nr:hypothetical protein [Blastocatellia bacterium]
MVGGKEDKVVDRLLRGEARRQRPSVREICKDFDPDLATAYLERNLSSARRTLYESHLIDCHFCRTAIAGLAALDGAAIAAPYKDLAASEPEQPAPVPLGSSSRPTWVERFATAFLTPQWITAAAAILIAIISVPLVLRLVGRQKGQVTYVAKNVDGAPNPATVQAMPAVPNAVAGKSEDAPAVAGRSQASGTATDQREGASAPAASEYRDTPTVSGQVSADKKAGEGDAAAAQSQPATLAGVASGAPVSKPPTANAPTSKDEAGGKAQNSSQNEVAPQGSPEGARGAEAALREKPLPRLDSKKALQLKDDESKTKVSELTHGSGSDEPQPSKEKVATIKPTDAVAPAPEGSTQESKTRGRAAIAGPPAKEFVTETKPPEEAHFNRRADSASTKLAKGERRVEGKKFKLVNGIWTDQGFKPTKEMPYVTVVRDSDVYKSLLAKYVGLKAYLDGFAPTERAIIVYKKIVYKLVPPTAQN